MREQVPPVAEAATHQQAVEVHSYSSAEGTPLRLLAYGAGQREGPPRPAIFWFHGGGWQTGRSESFAPFCRAGVAAGMVAFAPQYRLIGEGARTAWDSMADAHLAYRWVVERADDLGVDRQRIVLAGSSAGGHLAAYLATHHQDTAAAALVLLNPRLDCRERAQYLDGRGEEASPIDRVRPGLPPTLLVHGDADRTVPYDESVRFHRLMLAAGNDATLITMEGEDHGLWKRQTDRMIEESYGFLRRVGLATG